MSKLINPKLLALLFLLSGLLMTMSSCEETEEPAIPLSITETASSDAQFSSLVAALTKANLLSTIDNGTFTVFAPTNAAFDQLFVDLGVTGLDDLTAAQLEPILLYHVVAGDVRSTDLSNGYVGTASTGPNAQALKLQVDISNGVSLDNGTLVTSADVDCTNGVIHVIDKVLLPNDVVGLATGNSEFSSLVAALTRTDHTFDFVTFLQGTGPFTVFAPTNAAFQALLDSNSAWNSIDDIDIATLDAVLKYHVISGTNFESSSLSDGFSGVTAGGGMVTINTVDGVRVTDANGGVANVTLADVQGTNGVVHVIDKVLLP